ncbi:AAA family ATPase [Candidatus Peregrinibacteria bacterium]|nr:AAA family ATPase [Candidatus Peregrinibacteria bacterium]
MTNIIFTGLRGSGKTTIGSKIAEKLNREFFDVDEEIELNEKQKIKDIVDKGGWEAFRKLEKATCKNLAKKENAVIALGGGSILDDENHQALKTGHIIYLYADPLLCAQRVKGDENRPSLKSKNNLLEELQDLFIERDRIYRQRAKTVFIRSNNLNEDITKIKNLIQTLH